MSRIAKNPVTLFSLVGLLVLIPLVVHFSPSFARGPQQGPAIGATELQVALLRAGLSAESLTAAGVSSQQVSTIVTNARNEFAAQPTLISAADAAYAAAHMALDALQRKIASGLATQEEIASLATLTTALTTAQAQRQSALDTLVAAATQSLAPTPISRLHTIAANHSWTLPIEFLTVERAETEWIALRNALSNERIAAKYGDEPNAACQSLLSTARANPTVAAAKASMVANLATVSTAWDSATTGN
jgi:hypothetical protein